MIRSVIQNPKALSSKILELGGEEMEMCVCVCACVGRAEGEEGCVYGAHCTFGNVVIGVRQCCDRSGYT